MNPRDERKQQIESAIAEIRALHREHGTDRDSLRRSAGVLARLAQRRDLFSFADFPLPAPGAPLSTRYQLHVGEGQEYALYLQALLPGKKSVPHNHKTWAVIVAVEGEELNRIYQRSDDGSDPARGSLELLCEQVVRPGEPGLYLGDDIHSIHVVADRPALHFHLYGRALETLTERLAFDLESGRVSRYNETHWRPSVAA
ncbi:cysteine dioxygenase [Azoarcus sp. TTM-91]|uniref:cysteine dioxygenase family protein n=1 Tax=Azoarcus sp. TTM-91 TaxID=2691581 RepID=UPI00145FBA25|nr:cysteine dioxygenase family protein [Azoarcus sp. TTM-91]NMG35779.1 cysteine dioxygenase [Azoarcus sp. TTM-91]